MSATCPSITLSTAYAEVKPETASGVKKLSVPSCRGFAANDARVYRGCSDAEQKTASDYNDKIYRCYASLALGSCKEIMVLSGGVCEAPLALF